MLGFLFRGLTPAASPGAYLFDTLTAEARKPHWYVAGEIADTLDGRFAVLATVTAMALVRLEREGDAGNRLSVVLTERFIEVMESEHRELGVGDPTLGKVVRKLVAMLGRRVELWRSALEGATEWREATRESLCRDRMGHDALDHCAEGLSNLWERLGLSSLSELQQGRLA